jgi:hypothetical protein
MRAIDSLSLYVYIVGDMSYRRVILYRVALTRIVLVGEIWLEILVRNLPNRSRGSLTSCTGADFQEIRWLIERAFKLSGLHHLI